MSVRSHTPAPIPVVGLGAQTPLGRSVLSTAAAVRGRITGINRHPYIIDRMGERACVVRAPWIPAELGLTQRILELGVDAAREALAPAADALSHARARLTILVGLPATRPGLPPQLEQAVCRALSAAVPTGVSLSGARGLLLGHVAGLSAIDEACRLLRNDESDACLVGGIESYLDRTTLEWIDWTGQLMAESNPRGFVPGEAAGFCLLVSERTAQRCGLAVLGSVLGSATVLEQKLRRDRAVCLGEGLSESFRHTLSALPDPQKVDQLIYDFNGQPHRADEYGLSILRMGDRIADPGAF